MKKILTICLLVAMAALMSVGGTLSTTGKANPGKAADEPLITVLNPAIATKMADRIPLTPRLSTLEGKTIYMYDTQWGGPEAAHAVYEEMQNWFAKNMPSVKIVIHRGPGWMANDPGFPKLVTDNKVDAVIIGIAG